MRHPGLKEKREAASSTCPLRGLVREFRESTRSTDTWQPRHRSGEEGRSPLSSQPPSVCSLILCSDRCKRRVPAFKSLPLRCRFVETRSTQSGRKARPWQERGWMSPGSLIFSIDKKAEDRIVAQRQAPDTCYHHEINSKSG